MSATPTNGYEAAVKQVLALIASVWKCQALREEQNARINWRDKIDSGELTPPFAILTISRMDRQSGRGAADSNLFALPLSITLVAPQRMSGDQTNDIMKELVRLWQKIYRPGAEPTYYLDEDATSFDTSRQSDAQGVILDGSAPLTTGQLQVKLLVDLTPL